MSDIIQKDKKYVWHPFTQMQTADTPLEIIEAKNTLLVAADGKKYIDVNASWWVNVHGHGNEKIGKAIYDQFNRLDHVIFAGVTHPTAVHVAEKVVGLLGEPFSKVFFSDDGSTAVEVALKMAFQYWHNAGESRKRILALDGAYHGDTFGAMSVAQRGYFNQPFEHFFFDVDFLDFPEKENEERLLLEAEKLFQTNEFAGVIVEPLVQGSAGMRMYRSSFLDDLVTLAKKYGVLVIFDEVMTAWGRTGKLFAFEHGTARPDIICLSKGLTGGVLPLGLTVASEKIYTAFLSDDRTKALLHGHSFTGNALSCAAALASMELFDEKKTWDSIERIHKRHVEFEQQLSECKHVLNTRVLGTILAFEINTGEGNTYFSSIRDEAHRFLLKNGVFLRPLGNCLFLNPPYCITDDELKQVYDAVIRFVKILR